MKRITLIIAVMLITIVSHAQNSYDPMKDSSFMFDLIHILGTITAFFVISTFILALVKLFFDHRIKNRVIDKGVGETVVSQLLQPDKKENSNIAMKWFIIFAAIGVGITLVDAFQPFGLHSLAIMSFCIALGFLGYYYFTKKSNKQ